MLVLSYTTLSHVTNTASEVQNIQIILKSMTLQNIQIILKSMTITMKAHQ